MYQSRIPGQLNDRRTMLGELNWIFTAITDTIAWNTLPRGNVKLNNDTKPLIGADLMPNCTVFGAQGIWQTLQQGNSHTSQLGNAYRLSDISDKPIYWLFSDIGYRIG